MREIPSARFRIAPASARPIQVWVRPRPGLKKRAKALISNGDVGYVDLEKKWRSSVAALRGESAGEEATQRNRREELKREREEGGAIELGGGG